MTAEIIAATLVPVAVGDAPVGVPEVTSVHFDLENLTVTLSFTAPNVRVRVVFPASRGFRVLDEGDLIEMWVDRPDTDAWLNIVEAHGWKDQELARPGYLSATPDLREYLVVGINDCVSVLTYEAPTINTLR